MSDQTIDRRGKGSTEAGCVEGGAAREFARVGALVVRMVVGAFLLFKGVKDLIA